MKAKVTLFVLLSLGMLAGAQPARAITAAAAAAASLPSYHYVRLFYYTDTALAKASFEAHASQIDVIAPQDYQINADGSLSGSVDKDIISFAKAHKVKVMPLVTNGGFSRTTSQAFLGDSAKEATAINALVSAASANDYWGYQFDFEQMDASDKDLYTAFIQKAHLAFQAHGLTLSVAVIGKVSDNPSDYPNDLWDNLIGVYDYTALANASDFITVMSYDDPNSKQGPAPFPWYQQVVTYAIAHVPNNKLSLGIPTYYWQWNTATGKLVGIGGNEGINNVFAKYKATLKTTYDSTAQEPELTYTGAGGAKYNLWYENAQSIAPKVALASDNHLYGVSFWTLGLETPSTFSVIKE